LSTTFLFETILHSCEYIDLDHKLRIAAR